MSAHVVREARKTDLRPEADIRLHNALQIRKGHQDRHYNKMESYLLPYGSTEALAVARKLDAKITASLHESAS